MAEHSSGKLFFDEPVDPAGLLPGNFKVAAAGPAGSAETREIFLAPEISPPWLREGERLFLPIAGPRAANAARETGETLAWVLEKGVKAPLVTGVPGGSCALHFDPRAALEHILYEKYVKAVRPLLSYVPFDYHAVPGWLRGAAAGVFTAARLGAEKGARKFPRFPAEKSLEALIWALKSCTGNAVAGRFRVMLTHDVDEPASVRGIERLAGAEHDAGLRSLWFAAGKLFPRFNRAFEELLSGGHEAGLHEVRHDLKFSYLSEKEMRARLDGARGVVEQFAMKAFRSPYYLRTPVMMRVLGDYFEYDSSVPDSDSFTPSGGGGCALLRPYRAGRLTELPVGLPFEIPHLAGAARNGLVEYWNEKIEFARATCGMLVVNTHPDEHASGGRVLLGEYRRLLARLKETGAEFVIAKSLKNCCNKS